VLANALRAVRRDDEMNFPTLAAQTREERPDDAFVIRMRKRGENWAAGLTQGGRRCANNDERR